MHPKVKTYLSQAKAWQPEMEALRDILINCGLTEDFKWRAPCYTFEDNNIAILQPFKDACALMFFKGSLLKDSKGILEKPGENSQAAKRFRFTSLKEITQLKATIKAYIYEAIELEKAGLKVEFKEKNALKLPEELLQQFAKTPGLKTAFHALTPGRQRAYVMHFASAKQTATRIARIEKYIPHIRKGKGLNDR